MTGMPHQTSTLAVAQESLKMSKESGDRTFKLMAIGMMCVTGLATMFHAVHAILRDMREDRRHSRENSRPQPPPGRFEDTPVADSEEHIPQRRWTGRQELADRAAEESYAAAAHRQHGHGRHR